MSPESLLDLFVLSPVGMIEVDADGNVEVANLAAKHLLAPFTDSGSLDDLFNALASVAPDLGARARGFAGPRGVVIESLELLAPREQRGVQLSLVKIANGRFVVMVADASGLATARGMMSRMQQQLRAIDGAVRDIAIYTCDREGRVDSWNESAQRLHLFGAPDIIGQSVAMLLESGGNSDLHARDMLALADRNGWSEEDGYRRRQDGSTFWANTVVTALRAVDGTATAYSVVTRDLSEQRKLEDASREDATSTLDYLTGVSARRAFFEVAGAEVARARRYGHALSLLLVHADQFRELSDAHADVFTNEWLRTIASVCRQESRTTDFVGRVGGEEFAVLLPSTELSGGLVLAERIRERMQRHVFQGEFQAIRSTVSVGVADLSDSVTSVDALLASAATAVERAEQAGRNLVVGYDA